MFEETVFRKFRKSGELELFPNNATWEILSGMLSNFSNFDGMFCKSKRGSNKTSQ